MTSIMAVKNVRGEKIVNTSIAIAIIVTFAVILRFIARKKTKASLAADDWFILASLVPAYAMLVIASICWFIFFLLETSLSQSQFLQPEQQQQHIKKLIPKQLKNRKKKKYKLILFSFSSRQLSKRAEPEGTTGS